VYEFKLPDLGEGIHEAEILRWHISPGQEIERDAPLVDVETDKAAVTLPCPVAGTVVRLAGAVGEVIRVGEVVAVIEEGGIEGKSAPKGSPQESLHAPPIVSPHAAPQASPPAAPEADSPARSGTGPVAAAPEADSPAKSVTGPVAAAPATRRLARELGVDLGRVRATGPGGRVTPDDVRRASSRTPPEPASPAPIEEVSGKLPLDVPAKGASSGTGRGPGSGIPLLEVEPLEDFSLFGPVDKEPLRSIRRKVARRMTQSSLLLAQVSHLDEADVTELDALRRRERERRTGGQAPKLTLMAFVMKAVVAGLKQYRMFNASLDGVREELIYKRYYNLGVAVDSPKGLVVPVVHGADRLSVLGLAAALEELATRAREDRLEAADFQGGTFTLSNIGNLGGFSPNPLVNYPEVAILGLGRAAPKPVVRGGEIQIRTMLPLVLAFDHRIADGGESARFMNDLRRRLEDPMALLMES
jgi:pyruvate dehydrogenase E2 component (dihydrolipoamide acetyltransferase)